MSQNKANLFPWHCPSHCLYPSKLAPSTACWGKHHILTLQMESFFARKRLPKYKVWGQSGKGEQVRITHHLVSPYLEKSWKKQSFCCILDTISFTQWTEVAGLPLFLQSGWTSACVCIYMHMYIHIWVSVLCIHGFICTFRLSRECFY